MATTEESLTYEAILEKDGVKVSKSPWGPDDEIGTLNLIDDVAVARGLAAIAAGLAQPPPMKKLSGALIERPGADSGAALITVSPCVPGNADGSPTPPTERSGRARCLTRYATTVRPAGGSPGRSRPLTFYTPRIAIRLCGGLR